MKVLVTGGGGYVGGAVVRRLVADGDEVRTWSRNEHPALAGLPVAVHRGDLAHARHQGRLRAALEGCDVVVHSAARTGPWGPPIDFHRTNVLGTRRLLLACRAAGVARLVHVSSASVVHGGRQIVGGNESLPYASGVAAPYVRTKIRAEREVLAANGEALSTVALRPHLVWGPGDPHLVSRIVARGRAGRLAIVGDGTARIDTTYIDNAADSIVVAARRLREGAACAGRAYFVTDGEPRPVRVVFDQWLGAAGLPPVRRRVPVGLARGLASVVDACYRALQPRSEPLVTRLVVEQMCTSHHFDLAAARRDLGWSPPVTVAEGLRHLAEALARTTTHA